MKNTLIELFLHPRPVRAIVRRLLRLSELGSYELRLKVGAVDRAPYGYCVYNAAVLAKRLGYERISVLEFGVAGGNGLINLEHHARQTSEALSMDIDIYGFDIGKGLPEPLDYRDLPYLWKSSFYKMDVQALKARLEKSQLVLGDVRDTAKTFFSEYEPAPIGAVMFDLDFYSSTANALKIFDADERYFLPRIHCYFDDIIGSALQAYSEYTGVRLAINEFNDTHKSKKFGHSHHLLARPPAETWHHQIRIYHSFEHRQYNAFVGEEDAQFPLK